MPDRTKPKGSRNMTVGGHLYWWWTVGSDNDPSSHAAIIMDSETRKRIRVAWESIAVAEDGAPFYPILPKHVAAYIKTHIQKGD